MGDLLWFNMSEEASLLVSAETYEENAVNIGTQQKSADMSRFIDRVREDGLYLLDIPTTDARIRSIAALLNTYDAPSIMVVSARQYGQRPARLFAEAIGAHSAVGRFIPGSLTNPALRSYRARYPVRDRPTNDQQALREAVATTPIVGIVDANNSGALTLRCLHQQGCRSLALIYWLLAREVLKVRGETTDEAWAEANDLEEWESTF